MQLTENRNENQRLEDIWETSKAEGQKCAHDSCSNCKGTGRKQNGEICIHFISCRCRKCNPFYL